MSETTDPRGRSAAEIENDVERTRARVSETIDALRDSMSPGQIIDQVVDYARGSGGADFVRNLGTSVRENPLPVMMIGAGIGWLMLSGSNRGPAYQPARRPAEPLTALPPMNSQPTSDTSGPSATTRLTEAASSAKNTVGGTMSSAHGMVGDTLASTRETVAGAASATADAASRMGSQVASAAGYASDEVRRRRHDVTHAAAQGYATASDSAGRMAERARDGWHRMSVEQPLLIGALGLAVGAALGALIPRTQAEDRLMGEASDAMTRQLSEATQEQYAEAKEAVSEHLDEAKQAVAAAYEDAKQKLNKEGVSAQTLSETVRQAASQVSETVSNAGAGVAETAREAIDKVAPGTPEADHPTEPARSGSTGMTGAPRPAGGQPSGLHTPNVVVSPKV
ncbi:MAG: nutrient deprivation-induced protein [Roseomonas sp.]|nr:nutrient deprivation-induced protein [Roseomonas sp.]